MEIFSALLAICAGNSPVPGEFPAQRPVTRSFDVFFDLHPNKRLSKQWWWGWWFEMPSSPLWRHRNVLSFVNTDMAHAGNDRWNSSTWKTGIFMSWWRHQMDTFSALLAICAGNSPAPGEFPTQRPVTRSFDVFFDLHPNKRLSKQWWGWWFETPPCRLRRHRNVLSFVNTDMAHVGNDRWNSSTWKTGIFISYTANTMVTDVLSTDGMSMVLV